MWALLTAAVNVGTQAFESTYGAAASIVVLLIRVDCSAQIVLFGAEITRAYAGQRAGGVPCLKT